jgi:hypothetical protein
VVRLVVGVAVLHAVAAVLAVALAARMRRAWLVAPTAIVLPYVLATLPLLPVAVADTLVLVTPAAGFAARQTLVEYDHVPAYYAPWTGYFPLPWWAGLIVLCAYAALALSFAFANVGKNAVGSVRGETRSA